MTAIETTLSALAESLTGELHLPGTPDFDRLATPWNVAAPGRPAAVVAAADAADAAAALRFAARHGMQVAVQATGHGAAGIDAGTLLVHTGRLDECTIHPEGWARVGAGVRWGTVLDAAAAQGLAGLAGSSPNVGVVGYTTGGGVGPLARTFGAASDYVRAFEVVTADGVLRRATPTENPALYWGLRGGKGTLGIVTAVEFDLLPLREIYGGCLYFDGADAGEVLHGWRGWAEQLPEAGTTSLALMRLPEMPGVPEPLAGRLTVAVRLAWAGDPAEGARQAAGVRALGTPVLGGIDLMPYAALGTIHSDPVDPMPATESSALLHALPTEAVEALLAVAGPSSECPQVIVEVRQFGGALARGGEHPDAVSYRDAAFSLILIGIGVPPVVEPTRANAAAILGALAPWCTGGLLPNFAASEDPAVIARKYDAGTLARLATLAATFDPHGVLRAARPIRQACMD